MRVSIRLNELDVDVDAITCVLNTAFQNVGGPQFTRDFPEICRRALVARCGSARDDAKSADFRKRGDNFVLDALSKKRVLLVRAQILERKNGDALIKNRDKSSGWNRNGSGLRRMRWVLPQKEPQSSSEKQPDKNRRYDQPGFQTR